MKSRFLYHLSLLFVAFMLLSCVESGGEDTFSVQLLIPDEVEVDADDMKISFKVVGGLAPLMSDCLVLGHKDGTLSTAFTEVSSSRVYSVLPEDFESGVYVVSVKRDDAVKRMGETSISILKNDITINGDCNLYGKVTSQGEPLENVLVSDGVQIVRTDKDGVYRFKSDKKAGVVFVILPSGYEAPVSGVLPGFHRVLKKGVNEAERYDFKLTPSASQDNHTMLVFGDMHMANRSNNRDRYQFAEFTADVNSFMSAYPVENIYGLTLGDMTWDLYWYKNKYYFPEYLSDVNVIKGLPMFHTIGNHDHDMEASGDEETVVKYREHIAPTYYSFNIGKVHYVVLDNILCTNDGKGNRTYDSEVTEAQLNWLEKDLSYVDKTNLVVLCMHAPLYTDLGLNNMGSTSKIEKLLGQFNEAHIFSGHTHKVYNVDKLDSKHIYEHNAGAVCATWWWSGAHTPGIHIGQDGAPGGYTVVDVSGTDIKWQFKPTGGTAEKQFRTYDRNTISITADKYMFSTAAAQNKAGFEKFAREWKSVSKDNLVYINVWNYDSGWTIEVMEDGKPLDVQKVSIEDPLHLIAYTAPAMNSSSAIASGKPSFPTYPTQHIFKVKASSADSDLKVTVKDRFGKSYTEQMERPKDFSIEQYK